MLTVMEFNRNKQNEIQLKCKEKYIRIETGLAENSLTIDFKNLKEIDELIFYLEKFKERVRKNKCEEWLLQSSLVMKRVKNCAECPCYYKGKCKGGTPSEIFKGKCKDVDVEDPSKEKPAWCNLMDAVKRKDGTEEYQDYQRKEGDEEFSILVFATPENCTGCPCCHDGKCYAVTKPVEVGEKKLDGCIRRDYRL